MNKKFAALVVATLILTAVAPAQGQTPSKIPKIGFLGVRPDDSKIMFDLFRRQLQAIGYVDGKEHHFLSIGTPRTNPTGSLPFVDELIRVKVDVLVVAAGNEARAAKNATKTIPIVL